MDLKKTVTSTIMATTISIMPPPIFGVPCLWRCKARYFVASPPPSDASVRICFASLNRRKSQIYVGVISIATKKVTSPNTTIRKIL